MGQHGGIPRAADGSRGECHSVSDTVGKWAACGAKTTGVQLRRDRFLGSRVELRSATEVLSFLMHDHSNAGGCPRLTLKLTDPALKKGCAFFGSYQQSAGFVAASC